MNEPIKVGGVPKGSKRDTPWLITHGMTYTSIYRIWKGIISRCTDHRRKEYKNYGQRGIMVCTRWRDSFENFYADMGDRPCGAYIDRRDNNGNYEPDNCRWATSKQSARNRRNSKLIQMNGETFCLTEWCEKLELKYTTIKARIYVYGWDPVLALTFPVSKGGGLCRESRK